MKKTIAIIVFFLFCLPRDMFPQEWTYVNNTGTSFILYGMSFPPGQNTIGYACGMQYTYDAPGVIIKTTDGGENWVQIWPVSGEIDGLQGIWFTSDLTGFACGWNNYFIRTTDGGASWSEINVSNDVWYFTDVEFRDESNGIAVATMNSPGSQSAFITDDGGVSWVPASSGMAVNEVMGISYATDDLVFAAGLNGHVFKSADGGHNWSIINTLPAMLLGVDFANHSFGVIGAEEKMFATNDGGNTWTTYTTGYENFYACESFSNGTAFIGGTDENIYQTIDFGQSWTMNFNGTGESTLYRIRALADGTLFACGSQGKIMRRIPPLDADFTASATEGCPGTMVNFSDNSTGIIDSWSWAFEGGTPSSSNQQDPVVTYNSSGFYDVQLTVTSGINTNTELKTDYITVFQGVEQPPVPAGPAEVCNGSETGYSTPDHAGNSYTWEVTGGTITAGAGSAAISVLWGDPGTGTVAVTEISPDGCEAVSDALAVTITDCTGLEENSASNMHFFPNPAKDWVQITGPEAERISIYDLSGRLVLSFNDVENNTDLDISSLKKGIYLFVLEKGTERAQFRLEKL